MRSFFERHLRLNLKLTASEVPRKSRRTVLRKVHHEYGKTVKARMEGKKERRGDLATKRRTHTRRRAHEKAPGCRHAHPSAAAYILRGPQVAFPRMPLHSQAFDVDRGSHNSA